MSEPLRPDLRFDEAVRRFDLLNSRDPSRIVVGGESRPKELVYAERLADWIRKLDPSASEALCLAARCQHLERWKIPRSSYPDGRTGYLMWRKELARFHGDRAAAILRELGYDEPSIERVRSINQKKSLKTDPDVQTMEDALCLSFLEHEIEEFSAKHPEDKVVDILAKTWRKMSERGHTEALRLPFSERVGTLVKRALSP